MKTWMMSVRRGTGFCLLMLTAATLWGAAAAEAATTIGNYQLVSEVRISRTVSEYTYRATLANSGPALAGAAATAISLSPSTTMVDAALTFGPVGVGGAVVSTDTFSFRHNRLVPFDFANIQWTIFPQPANTAPQVDAGPDLTVTLPQTAALAGSVTDDDLPAPPSLTIAWTQQSGPGVAAFADAASPATSASFSLAGLYVLRLTASDGEFTAFDETTVTVLAENQRPVANAGPNQTAPVGVAVVLDGSGSSDTEGATLSYAWSFVSRPTGSTAALVGADTVNPTFTIDRPGDYVVELVVGDGSLLSLPDIVTISTSNSAPVANAGPDQSANVGDLVTLDGSASSDVDGDTLTYAWSFLSRPPGSTTVLSDPTAVGPTFVIDEPGDYVVQLVVHDGLLASVADLVTVSTLNSRPVANAGPNQTVLLGALVTLDGSASSDVDGDTLTYAWSLTSVPPGSTAVLSDATAVMPTFVADEPGTYVAQLIVNDGALVSLPDTVMVTTQNSAPVADAGPDQSVVAGSTVTLDGTGSFDPDGDPISYAWAFTTLPPGSTATLTGPDTPAPSFVVDQPGTFVVQLVVSDGLLSSSADTVSITTGNSAPIANAGFDQLNVPVGALVTLNGALSSDADGHPLSYSWSFSARPPGSAAVLSGTDTVAPSFTPDIQGDYVVQLIVHDGFVSSPPDTVVIRANSIPVADAGPDQGVAAGALVLLDGSASTDADGDPLTYLWQFLTLPPGSSAVLTDADTTAPTFVADVSGGYLLQLTVTDDLGAAASDVVVVTATGAFPVVSIVATDPDASEVGTNTGTFTIARVGDTSAALTVGFTVGGTASAGVDYTEIGTSAVIPAGLTAVDVTLTPVADGVDEEAETVLVTLTDGADYDLGVPASATVTITDDDRPTVTVEATDAAAAEAGLDPGVFTFTRSGPSAAPLTVFFGVGGNATNGNDYTPALTGSVTIAAGLTSAAVTVTPAEDTAFEGDETVIVTLATNAAYIIGGTGTATITIVDNDLPEVSVAATDATAAEAGLETGTFTFTRTGPPTTPAPLVIFYDVTGSATSGGDYTALAGNVTIPADQQSATVTVSPLDDPDVEGDETVVVTIAVNPAYVVGASNTATVTIIDDEVPVVTVVATDPTAAEVDAETGTFTVTRSGTTTDPLVVTFALSGSASDGADYCGVGPCVIGTSVTIPAGAPSATVTVVPFNDSLVEGPETAILTLTDTLTYDPGTPSSATVTITDAPIPVITLEALDPDASEATGDPGRFRFTRTGDTSPFLFISVTVGGSAENGNDYGFSSASIFFSPGSATTDVDIHPVNDGVVEGPETVVLTLEDGDHYDLGAGTTGTVTIADNPVPLVSVMQVDTDASEVGPDPGLLRFARTGSTALPLTVNFTRSGTALNVTDYADIGSSVTFLTGQATVDLAITPVTDAIPEGTEFVFVELIDGPDYDLGSPAAGTVFIADSSPTVDVVATDPEAGENGPDPGTFTFTRSGGTGSLAAPLVVNFTISGTATEGVDYTAVGMVVAIPAGQASTIVTVAPIPDALEEPTETVFLTVAPGLYNINAGFAAVNIGDSGEPIVTVVATDPDASEVGPDGGSFAITRTGSTASAMAVFFEVTGTAGNFGDYQGIFGSALIDAGQVSVTVPVSPFNDPTVEGPETVILTLLDAADYDLGAATSATVTIQDQPTPIVNIVATDPDASEVGPDPGEFTITRTGDTTFGLSVFLAAIEGTAGNFGDYQGLQFSYSIEPGQTSTTVVVNPINDPFVEGPETVVLTLFDGPGAEYDLGASTMATVTIQDQPTPIVSIVATDPDASEVGLDPGEFTITRTGDTTFGLSVFLAAIEGTAGNFGDYQGLQFSYSIEPGQTSTTVVVNPINDPFVEGPETVVFTLFDGPGAEYDLGASTMATVTIQDQPTPIVSIVATDPDASEVGLDPGEFTITRTGDTTFGLSVFLAAIEGTAGNFGDYQGLQFSYSIEPGQTSTTVVVNPINDPFVEGPETVVFTLFDGPGVEYDLGASTMATVTITDQLTPIVNIVATDPDASEVGPDPGEFTITRTGDTTFGLGVQMESVTGTAIYGSDYVAFSGSLFIPPGETSVTVVVTPFNDGFVEGPETVIVTLFDGPGMEYDLGASTMATVTITDQPTPIVNIVATDPDASEAGPDEGTFTITRTGDTAFGLSVAVESVGGSATFGADYAVFSGSIFIPAGETSATLTVTPFSDAEVEGDETVIVTLLDGPGLEYDLGTATATVTVADSP